MANINGTGNGENLYGLVLEDDVIKGGNGNDTIFGYGGNDTIAGGGGVDSIDGGGGADLIHYGLDASEIGGVGVEVRLDHGYTQSRGSGQIIDRLNSIENVIATAYNDAIFGSGEANLLLGLAGNDFINGGGGNDLLSGGGGADTLDGGDGTDTVSYKIDSSDADGYGDGWGFKVNLGNGYVQKANNEQIFEDLLYSIENAIGSDARDALLGTGGANLLAGEGGSDTITAYGGDDVLSGGAGTDTLDGGDGTDTLTYKFDDEDANGFGGSVGFRIDLTTGRTTRLDNISYIEDTHSSIENVIGSDVDDVVIGTEYNNNLQGGAGQDSVSGGAGNDTISGGAGWDTLDGGAGTDLLSFGGSATGIALNLAAGSAAERSGSLTTQQFQIVSNIDLNAGDVLTLTLGGQSVSFTVKEGEGSRYSWPTKLREAINSDPELSVLYTTSGVTNSHYQNWVTARTNLHDTTALLTVNGVNVTGSQVLQSRAGDGSPVRDAVGNFENVAGSSYDDVLVGDTGTNVIYGLDGNDTIAGGDGSDILAGGAGNNLISGGAGFDTLSLRDRTIDAYNTPNNTIAFTKYWVDLNAGQAGTISHTGALNAANDTITGIEAVSGSYGDDYINGNSGANLLSGWRGSDTLLGGYGDDTLSGGGGRDILDGGDGRDTAAYNVDADEAFGFTGTTGFDINLAAGSADRLGQHTGSGDVLISIENVTGSEVNDRITGNGEFNVLIGRAGDDSIDGGAGNDILSGGLGIDTLNGGAGDDFVQYGIDRDEGQSYGATGLDINLVQGQTRLNGGTNAIVDHLISIENVSGSARNDRITGTDGSNFLTGAGGNDEIRAGGGNDQLVGGEGADTLDGGEGTDTVFFTGSEANLVINLADGIAATQAGASGGTKQAFSYSGAGGTAAVGDIVTLQLGALRVSYQVEEGQTAAQNWSARLFEAAQSRGDITALYQFGSVGASTTTISALHNLPGVTASIQINGTAIANGITQIAGSNGGHELDRLISIENVTGGANAELIIGTDGANVVASGGGADRIYARGGNDVIYDGAGDAVIDGGAGSDTVYFHHRSKGVIADLTSGVTGEIGTAAGTTQQFRFNPAGQSLQAGDVVTLKLGHFTVAYRIAEGSEAPSDWAARLVSEFADDPALSALFTTAADPANPGGTLITARYALEDLTPVFEVNGQAVSSQVISQTRASSETASRDTLVSIEGLVGSDSADLFVGDRGANRLIGGGGNDTLIGGGGNDLLMGGAGINIIDGGSGADTVVFEPAAGQAAADLSVDLEAGYGGSLELVQIAPASNATYAKVAGTTNIFQFPAAFAQAQSTFPDILNFENGIDKIDLSALGITSFSQLQISRFAAQSGNSGLPGDIDANAVVITGFGDGRGIVIRDSGTGDANFLDASDFIFAGQLPAGTGPERYRAYLDQLSGIENAITSGGNDVVLGSDAGNVLIAKGGNDRLEGRAGDDLLDGGTGKDTLEGGEGFDTARFADAVAGVNIDLVAGTARATLAGGAVEVDTLTGIEGAEGGAFNDTITGTGGVNVLQGQGGDDLINAGDGNDRVTGDDGNDTLNAGSGDDVVLGGLGNDVLRGDDGNDILLGADGNDNLLGGANGDVLSGGLGNDTLDGGAGTDTASYSLDASALDDGSGAVHLSRVAVNLATGSATKTLSNGQTQGEVLTAIENVFATAGNDTVTGNTLANELRGLDGNDQLSGGASDDRLFGGAGNDTLSGDADDDYLEAGAGDDSLSGGTGNDVQLGGTGNDVIEGGDGNDILDGGLGRDTLDGGAGIDTLSFALDGSGPAAGTAGSLDRVTVDLGAGTATSHLTGGTTETETVSNFENVAGSSGNDGLTGSAGDNFLAGLHGADTVSAGAGNDTVDGSGYGSDVLDGGSGDDTLTYKSHTGLLNSTESGVTIDLSAGIARKAGGQDTISGFENADGSLATDLITGTAGANRLNGLDGNDILSGGAGSDTILGDDGADMLDGGIGNDTIDGGSGIDTLRVDLIANQTNDAGVVVNVTGATIDLAAGTASTAWSDGTVDSDSLISIENAIGSDGADTIAGSTADNALLGGAGADSVSGGAGNDHISGGRGSDTLDGGAGNDIVNYSLDIPAAGPGQPDPAQISGVEVNLANGQGIVNIGGTIVEVDVLSNIEGAVGSRGSDFLVGDDKDNVFVTLEGNDVANGGAGNDVIYAAGPGDKTIDGGTGNDQLSYFGHFQNLDIDLARGTVLKQGDTDTFIGIENAEGGAGDDILTGDSAANQLFGGQGNDTISGGAGNDLLEGGGGRDVLKSGSGNDTLDGGGGIDTADWSDAGNQSVTVNLAAGTATVSTAAGTETDTLRGIEIVRGTAGNDTFVASGAKGVVLDGGAGTDTYRVSSATEFAEIRLSGGDTLRFDDLNSGDLRFSLAYVPKDGITAEQMSGGVLSQRDSTLGVTIIDQNSGRIVSYATLEQIGLASDPANPPTAAQIGTALGNHLGSVAFADGSSLSGSAFGAQVAGTVEIAASYVDTVAQVVKTDAGDDYGYLDSGRSIIQTGTGADAFDILGGTHIVDTGADADTVYLKGGNNDIATGAGDDAVFINGGSNYVHVGAGSNRVVIDTQADGAVIDLTGAESGDINSIAFEGEGADNIVLTETTADGKTTTEYALNGRVIVTTIADVGDGSEEAVSMDAEGEEADANFFEPFVDTFYEGSIDAFAGGVSVLGESRSGTGASFGVAAATGASASGEGVGASIASVTGASVSGSGISISGVSVTGASVSGTLFGVSGASVTGASISAGGLSISGLSATGYSIDASLASVSGASATGLNASVSLASAPGPSATGLSFSANLISPKAVAPSVAGAQIYIDALGVHAQVGRAEAVDLHLFSATAASAAAVSVGAVDVQIGAVNVATAAGATLGAGNGGIGAAGGASVAAGSLNLAAASGAEVELASFESVEIEGLGLESFTADVLAAAGIDAEAVSASALSASGAEVGAITADALDVAGVQVEAVAANAANVSGAEAGVLTADALDATGVQAEAVSLNALNAGGAELEAVAVDAVDATLLEAEGGTIDVVDAGIAEAEAGAIDVLDATAFEAEAGTLDVLDAGLFETEGFTIDFLDATAVEAEAFTADVADLGVVELEAFTGDFGDATIAEFELFTLDVADAGVAEFETGTLDVADATVIEFEAGTLDVVDAGVVEFEAGSIDLVTASVVEFEAATADVLSASIVELEVASACAAQLGVVNIGAVGACAAKICAGANLNVGPDIGPCLGVNIPICPII